MKSAKIESLLKTHAAILVRTRRELAMNFEVPARDIIGMACSEMGISESMWRAMESYRIAQEEAA